MAYNEQLADRVRMALSDLKGVEEKKMFGGIAFMVNDKMCVGVDKSDLILRCEADETDEMLSRRGVRPFDLSGKPMKGWLLVGTAAISKKADFDKWIQYAIEYNKKFVAVKKTSKSKIKKK